MYMYRYRYRYRYSLPDICTVYLVSWSLVKKEALSAASQEDTPTLGQVLVYRYYSTGTSLQVLLQRYLSTGTSLQVLFYWY